MVSEEAASSQNMETGTAPDNVSVKTEETDTTDTEISSIDEGENKHLAKPNLRQRLRTVCYDMDSTESESDEDNRRGEKPDDQTGKVQLRQRFEMLRVKIIDSTELESDEDSYDNQTGKVKLCQQSKPVRIKIMDSTELESDEQQSKTVRIKIIDSTDSKGDQNSSRGNKTSDSTGKGKLRLSSKKLHHDSTETQSDESYSPNNTYKDKTSPENSDDKPDKKTNSKRNSTKNRKGQTKIENIDDKSEKKNSRKTYPCKKCDKKFTKMKELSEHRESHKGKKLYQCPKCDKFFSYRSGEITANDRTAHECPYCELTIENLEDLKTKLRNHGKGSDEFKCPECDKIFKGKTLYEKHAWSHSNIKQLECTYCEKTFASKFHLENHIRTHTKDTPFKCVECGKAFKYKTSLNVHVQTHAETQKSHVCYLCGKAFGYMKSLTHHLATIHGEGTVPKRKSYQCEECGKWLKRKHLLTEHMMIHTGEQKFKCCVCDRSFTHNSGLHVHMITHTGERKYVCKICGKAFTQQNALTRHQLVHTGEKPHECQFCHKRFSQKPHLQKHVRQSCLGKGIPGGGETFARPVRNKLFSEEAKLVERKEQKPQNDISRSRRLTKSMHVNSIKTLQDVGMKGTTQKKKTEDFALVPTHSDFNNSYKLFTLQGTHVRNTSHKKSEKADDFPAVVNRYIDSGDGDEFGPLDDGEFNVDDLLDTLDKESSKIDERSTGNERVNNDKFTNIVAHTKRHVHSYKDMPMNSTDRNSTVIKEKSLRANVFKNNKLENAQKVKSDNNTGTQMVPFKYDFKAHGSLEAISDDDDTVDWEASDGYDSDQTIVTKSVGNKRNESGEIETPHNEFSKEHCATESQSKTSNTTPKRPKVIAKGQGQLEESGASKGTESGRTMKGTEGEAMKKKRGEDGKKTTTRSGVRESLRKVKRVKYTERNDGEEITDLSDEYVNEEDESDSGSSGGSDTETESGEKEDKIDKTPQSDLYRCPKCNKFFGEEKGKKTLKCFHCQVQFDCLVQFKTKLKTEKKNSACGFQCTMCDKMFKMRSGYYRHAWYHSNIKPYQCTLCDKSFKNSSHLVVHTRIHTGEQPYVCDICGKAFAHKYSLEIHTKTHTGSKPHKCAVCERAFAEKSQLRNHMARIHNEGTVLKRKPHQCEKCGRWFKKKHLLSEHIMTHTGEKNYSCSTCGKLFTHKSGLHVHMKIHTGERNHVCKTCGKAFTQRNALTRHQLVHTGEKPHECQFCHKCFSQKPHLQKHVRQSCPGSNGQM